MISIPSSDSIPKSALPNFVGGYRKVAEERWSCLTRQGVHQLQLVTSKQQKLPKTKTAQGRKRHFTWTCETVNASKTLVRTSLSFISFQVLMQLIATFITLPSHISSQKDMAPAWYSAQKWILFQSCCRLTAHTDSLTRRRSTLRERQIPHFGVEIVLSLSLSSSKFLDFGIICMKIV